MAQSTQTTFVSKGLCYTFKTSISSLTYFYTHIQGFFLKGKASLLDEANVKGEICELWYQFAWLRFREKERFRELKETHTCV